MSQNFEKLKTLLQELFQLNQPDLDFGLYRVMHAKSAEVTQFLDKDLLPQVKASFSQYQTADKAEIEKELAKAVEQAHALGADPESMPKVRELRARLATEAVDIGALESEVYDHLFSFFRRYYSEGDFLARRVYKPGVYAIPYEGEEVTLHWANKDQYYIKTSEYLRDYAFRLRPQDSQAPMRVHFRLADVAEGEHGNVKAAEGRDRVFILVPSGESGRDFIVEEDGEQGKGLVIGFEYRPATLTDWPDDARDGRAKPPAQKDLTPLTARRVLSVADASLASWIAELGKPHITAGGEQADYTRLEAHLRRYTARNTFDYFIHKDLGGFLRRELDFYIKNEVMHLDDVENETAPRVEQYLSKIKVIRRIAGKIIDFLAQLEDFQKRLWLKKKFVVETSYCITLGCIPEEFYPEIAANEAQREEWVKLYAIDEMGGDLTAPGYSVSLRPGFLKAHPTLVVDTRHFDAVVAARLLEALGDLDELADGVCLHSENFQALSLLQARYAHSVACCVVDPPYNTGSDGFVYRDNYRHSSWLSMMDSRLDSCRRLLRLDGGFAATIDDNEQTRLRFLLDAVFGPESFVAQVAWEKRYTRSNNTDDFTSVIDYLPLYSASPAFHPTLFARDDDADARYSNPDNDPRGPWKAIPFSNPRPARERPGLCYAITNPHTGKTRTPFGEERAWRSEPSVWDAIVTDRRDWWGKDGTAESPSVKRFLSDVRPGMTPINLWEHGFAGHTDAAKNEVKSLFGYGAFDNPKPTQLIRRVVQVMAGSAEARVVLDFFAGSGTTGHAVMNMNREDGGRCKFILVEMADYFDTVLLARIKKVTFTPEWKDGKPKRLATREEADRGPRIIKVVRLESYEDALNNLETRRTDKQQLLLDAADARGPDGLKEQYTLRYMLNVETRGSQSLLNVQAFTDPTAYKLKVKRPGSDESREVNVDLLETFNWLIGLTVRHLAAPRTFSAAFKRDSETRLRLNDRLKQDADGPYWFRTVTGTTPDGRHTLVIWRKLTGEPEQDNLVLDEWFTKQGYSAKDSEFDLIYVNGGNNLENLKAPDDTWKVRLIEEDFHRLMFEMEGV
jgi:adenine-specific DNA-methyltransferase